MPDLQGTAESGGLHGTGTSAATALTTRAAHRLFDLHSKRTDSILAGLDPLYFGVITKALLVHTSRWGDEATMVASIFGPSDGRRHVERGDNVATGARVWSAQAFDEAMDCAPNRATLVGCAATWSPDGTCDALSNPAAAESGERH